MTLTVGDPFFLDFPLYTLHDLAYGGTVQVIARLHETFHERNVRTVYFCEFPVRQKYQALGRLEEGQYKLHDLEVCLELLIGFVVAEEFEREPDVFSDPIGRGRHAQLRRVRERGEIGDQECIQQIFEEEVEDGGMKS